MDKTKMALAVFDQLAQQYQDKFMDVGLYSDSFDLFCSSITRQNPAILELACGPGNITRYLLAKRPDFKILGTDLAPNMLHLAGINNPSATFRLLDCRDIAGLQEQYDGIMCGFALPYLSREEALQLIADVPKILKPGGTFYLSTMEDDYSRSGLQTSGSGDKIFMHYHEEDYLVRTIETNGMEVLHMQHLDYRGDDDTQTTDLVIIAGKL